MDDLRFFILSKKGVPVAQWVKCWPIDLVVPSSIPARGEIFSTVNGVPLHTAFHYHPSIVLIRLQYCWKGRKITNHPSSIHPFQKYFSHIRKMGGWYRRNVCNKTPFTNEKLRCKNKHLREITYRYVEKFFLFPFKGSSFYQKGFILPGTLGFCLWKVNGSVKSCHLHKGASAFSSRFFIVCWNQNTVQMNL